jgi:hypothetical protein
MRIGIVGAGSMGATLAAQLTPARASGRDRQLPRAPGTRRRRRPDRRGHTAPAPQIRPRLSESFRLAGTTTGISGAAAAPRT